MIGRKLPSWRSERRNNHAFPYNYDPYRRQLRNLPQRDDAWGPWGIWESRSTGQGTKRQAPLLYLVWTRPRCFCLARSWYPICSISVRFLDSYAAKDQHSSSGPSARHHRYGQSSDGTSARLSGKVPQATTKTIIVWPDIHTLRCLPTRGAKNPPGS